MNSLRWKFTHGRSWLTTDATVDSCEWTKSHAAEIGGHYQVKFSYQAGESTEIKQGEFRHQGNRHIVPYFIGEHLAVQYDPKKPSRYHFSGADDPNYEKLEAILVATVFALLAGYFLYAV